DAVHVGFDAGLAGRPAGAVDVGGESGDLEVILDVAGHRIADAFTRARRGALGEFVHVHSSLSTGWVTAAPWGVATIFFRIDSTETIDFSRRIMRSSSTSTLVERRSPPMR